MRYQIKIICSKRNFFSHLLEMHRKGKLTWTSLLRCMTKSRRFSFSFIKPFKWAASSSLRFFRFSVASCSDCSKLRTFAATAAFSFRNASRSRWAVALTRWSSLCRTLKTVRRYILRKISFECANFQSSWNTFLFHWHHCCAAQYTMLHSVVIRMLCRFSKIHNYYIIP